MTGKDLDRAMHDAGWSNHSKQLRDRLTHFASMVRKAERERFAQLAQKHSGAELAELLRDEA